MLGKLNAEKKKNQAVIDQGSKSRKKSCTISRFVHDKIFSCTIFFVHDKCSIVHDFLGSKDFLEYFFVVFFSKTLRLKTTEMIFLKIINKKEVLSLLRSCTIKFLT